MGPPIVEIAMLPLPPLLDHVVVNVLHDLDDAAERYRRLGFQLTPRGHHTLGTSNNLAIFGTDYLELLGYERGRPATRVDLVDTPPGLAGLVFKPPADPAFADALIAAGLPADPSREFSRPVDLPDGPHDASFRTTNLRGVLDSGRVFFCHHHTPDLVWRDAWRRHPNGVTAITGFTVVAVDPARSAEPFARLFGKLRRVDDGLVLQAGAAQVRFLSPDDAARQFGDAVPGIDGGADRMVALELRTASLAAARAVIEQGGTEIVATDPARLLVPARAACGVALVFA